MTLENGTWSSGFLIVYFQRDRDKYTRCQGLVAIQ